MNYKTIASIRKKFPITEEMFNRLKNGDSQAKTYIYWALNDNHYFIEKLLFDYEIDAEKVYEKVFAEFEKEVFSGKFQWQGEPALRNYFRKKAELRCRSLISQMTGKREKKGKKRKIKAVRRPYFSLEQVKFTLPSPREILTEREREEEREEWKEGVEQIYSTLEKSLSHRERVIWQAENEVIGNILETVNYEIDDAVFLKKVCVLRLLRHGPPEDLGLQKYLKLLRERLKSELSDNIIYINRSRVIRKFKDLYERKRQESGFYI